MSVSHTNLLYKFRFGIQHMDYFFFFIILLYSFWVLFKAHFSCSFNMRVSKQHFLFSTEPFTQHTNRISIPAFLKMVCLSAKLQIPTATASSTFAGQSNGKAMTVKMHVGTLGFQWRQHGRLNESNVSRGRRTSPKGLGHCNIY